MKDSDDTSYQECQDWTNTVGDCTNRLRVLGIFILFLCFVVIVKSGSMAENMEINKAKDGCYAIEKEAEYLEGVIHELIGEFWRVNK